MTTNTAPMTKDEAPVSVETKEAAWHVLSELGGHKFPPPGSFTTHLLTAALRADMANLARLELGFPELIRAVRLWKFDVRGEDILHAEAAGFEL